MNDDDSVGNRVRARRLELRLSRAELARGCSVDVSSIAKLEDGQVRTPKYIVQLADMLQTSPQWLVGGHRQPVSEKPVRADGEGKISLPQPHFASKDLQPGWIHLEFSGALPTSKYLAVMQIVLSDDDIDME